MKKTVKIRPKMTLPKVVKSLADHRQIEKFPLSHYSYSTFVKFSTNPILFKIQYINGETIDTTRGISGVIGQSFHRAMEVYYAAKESNNDDPIQEGLEAGTEFLYEYEECFIEFSQTVPNKQKAQEVFAFAYNSYVTDKKHDEGETMVSCEELFEESVNVEWRGEKLDLPVNLKGYTDKVVRDKENRLKIKDYKVVRSFSDPEKIDGAKIIQAIQYYLGVYAKYGEEPYSMTFEEVKCTKNRDGSSQVKEYEMIYKGNEQFFDFYFRMYDDMTRAINGEAVFVPNIYSMFDNEVAMVAYINRLDVSEEAAAMMKKLRVKTITDLLKKKIEVAGSMRKFLKTAETKFINAAGIKYESMTIEEKIKTKFMEHGMLISFEDKIEGHSVDLYRFNPSIGLKMSKLLGYVADIEQVVGSSGVRVLAPIPNTSLIGFEVPRAHRTYPGIATGQDGYNLAIGVDVYGKTYTFDITKAPHMLIAGATGSGKSVFLNSIISQISSISGARIRLFDPKMVELSRFRNAPGVVEYFSKAEDIYLALKELVSNMNDRYAKLSEAGCRNIDEYNSGNFPTKMAYNFVVIDEFGDLIVSNEIMEEHIKTGEYFLKGPRAGEEKIEVRSTNLSKEISKDILILAQKARAAGIHLIIATQRPSVDIITGSIKANFPTKVAFRMAKEVDSRVLLDESGAEKLLGKGDMIFSSDEGNMRLQGFNS